MKIKFSSTSTPKCHCLHLVYHDDVPGNLRLYCRSRHLCSTRRNLLSRSANLSKACVNSGIPVVDGAISYLLISSPTDLCSDGVNTRCACGTDPCLSLLSEYEYFHCYISGLAILDTASECLTTTLHNGTSSPILDDMSSCLQYEHCVDSLPCQKDKNLYRNLSRRNKLRGFNPLFG